jgi:hypothetical protein
MKSRYHMAFLPALCAVAVFTGSCRPEVELPITDNANRSYFVRDNSYREIAFTFWQGVNLNYVFWDIEPVRLWDYMLELYLPEISALGAPTNDANDGQFMEYLKKMSASLHDGHFRVQYKNYNFSPQGDRVNARFSGIDDDTNPELIFRQNVWRGNKNFAEDLIIPKYLTGGGSSATLDGLCIAQGKIDITGVGYIAYFYFNGFYLSEITAGHQLLKESIDEFRDNLYKPECKGLIFDVRGNSGGRTADMEYLISPLLTQKLHFANTRNKKNEGRLSYTPWIPYTVYPEKSIPNAGKIPVVALINDYSISCAELLALAVKVMPHGYLVGTRTWGATGPRIGDDYPNALNDGGFTVGLSREGFLKVVQAGYQTRGKNFENYEGIGVEPHQYVPFSQNEFTNNGIYDGNGYDRQLEAAIDHIKNWYAN